MAERPCVWLGDPGGWGGRKQQKARETDDGCTGFLVQSFACDSVAIGLMKYFVTSVHGLVFLVPYSGFVRFSIETK